MANKKAAEVKEILNTLYPKTSCFLHYEKDWQLLFAVILSAQATDVSVNAATSILFEKFPTLSDYTEANREQIGFIIKPVGLGKSKTGYLLKTASILLEKYGGVVPKDRDALVEMPGVGYKTSGVVLAELYDYPFIPVDTHVKRVTSRIGLVSEKLSPEETEKKLEKLYRGVDCINTHRQFILLGRNICMARNPDCSNCPLSHLCQYKKSQK